MHCTHEPNKVIDYIRKLYLYLMLLHTNLQHLSWEEVQHEDVRSQMETFLCVSRDGSVKYGLNESDSWPSLQCD